jgi:hypothetical protein
VRLLLCLLSSVALVLLFPVLFWPAVVLWGTALFFFLSFVIAVVASTAVLKATRDAVFPRKG